MSVARDKAETGLFFQEETANSGERVQRLIEILDQAFAEGPDLESVSRDDTASPKLRTSTLVRLK